MGVPPRVIAALVGASTLMPLTSMMRPFRSIASMYPSTVAVLSGEVVCCVLSVAVLPVTVTLICT
jgi:hypothetical protein